MTLPKSGVPHVYTDIRVLLRELHEGVLELGIGKCEVLAHDLYQELKFGFDLLDSQDERVWEFLIPSQEFKRTSEALSPGIREEFTTLNGRARLARMIQVGMTLDVIEERLMDPATLFILQRIKKLRAGADKALADRRPLHSATHFFLQYEIHSLACVVADMDLGQHLPVVFDPFAPDDDRPRVASTHA